MYSSSQVRAPPWNQYMAPFLLTMGSLSLWETSRFLMVLLPLKCVCIPYLPQIFLILSTETLGVWYDYVTLGFYFIGSGLDTCSTLAISPIIDLTGRPRQYFLHLVQSPLGIFAIGKSFPEMLHFFLEDLRIATGLFGTYG